MIYTKEQKNDVNLRPILNFLTIHILTYLIDFPNFEQQLPNIHFYHFALYGARLAKCKKFFFQSSCKVVR